MKAVQSALGHEEATTTLETYAHLWPEDDDRIREAIERTWAGSAEDKLRTSEAE